MIIGLLTNLAFHLQRTMKNSNKEREHKMDQGLR